MCVLEGKRKRRGREGQAPREAGQACGSDDGQARLFRPLRSSAHTGYQQWNLSTSAATWTLRRQPGGGRTITIAGARARVLPLLEHNRRRFGQTGRTAADSAKLAGAALLTHSTNFSRARAAAVWADGAGAGLRRPALGGCLGARRRARGPQATQAPACAWHARTNATRATAPKDALDSSAPLTHLQPIGLLRRRRRSE